MKNQQFRLEGVYNDQSFQIAHQNEVKSLTLDFRPRSFNFIPIKHCLELLEIWKDRFEHFHLLFSDDSELVVSEIYSRVHAVVGNRITLEFEYFKDKFDYRSLPCPFHLWAGEIEAIEKAILQPSFSGLVFENNFLEDLKKENIFKDYMKEIKNLMLSNQRNDISISLKLDWDTRIIANFEKWFSINDFILSVSKEVEKRYRVIHPENFVSKLHNVRIGLINN